MQRRNVQSYKDKNIDKLDGNIREKNKYKDTNRKITNRH